MNLLCATSSSENDQLRITGAPNDRFLGNDLKWLVMHPGVL